MIKLLKSNKLLSLLLIIMCIIIILKPSTYIESSLNGISVWAFKVLPLILPFFILTRLILSLSSTKKNFMDKLFYKLYHTPNGSFSTFFLSALSGYPMGAKLISQMYSSKQISSIDAQKMMSFCSISGPIFMIGTVGVAILNSFSAGLIILISNILASLINGLLYRGKRSGFNTIVQINNKQKTTLADCVYDSLISVLMVGAYIVMSFIVIDILKNLKITSFISSSICSVVSCDNSQYIVEAIINGVLEITRGIYDLSFVQMPLNIKTIITSSLIGFGGFSVMLQNFSFIDKIKIPFKKMLIQKITQSLLCALLSTPLALIFLC